MIGLQKIWAKLDAIKNTMSPRKLRMVKISLAQLFVGTLIEGLKNYEYDARLHEDKTLLEHDQFKNVSKESFFVTNADSND